MTLRSSGNLVSSGLSIIRSALELNEVEVPLRNIATSRGQGLEKAIGDIAQAWVESSRSVPFAFPLSYFVLSCSEKRAAVRSNQVCIQSLFLMSASAPPVPQPGAVAQSVFSPVLFVLRSCTSNFWVSLCPFFCNF